MEQESRALQELSELDRILAVTEDPVELKKGSDAIETIRGFASRSHMSLEIVNRAFFERVKWDRKRGAWIEKNIPKHNEKNDSVVTSRLRDIETSWDESAYCQKLLEILDKKVLELVGLCTSGLKEASKAALLRYATSGSSDYDDPELPAGTYEVIYADPGWQYDNFNTQNAAQVLYTTWPADEIAKKFGAAIEKVSSLYSVLFLWAVNPMLPEALQVMDAWGFRYKTNLAWVKPAPLGKAWWARSQHELLLIGVRSKTRKPAMVPASVLFCERGEHSEKPEEFRIQIEMMYPAGSWLELFARKKSEGWEVYGDEARS